MKPILSALAIVSLAGLSQADVIVTGGWLNTISSGLYAGSPAINDIKTDVPTSSFHKTATATFNGIVNNTSFDYEVTGSTGHLLTSFDQHADAVAGQYGEPHSQGEIYFTVTDAPVLYFLSGEYAINGSPYLAETSGLRAGKSVLFENYQTSNNTMNEDFHLGENGGDFSNSLTGSLTGLLDVGSYTLSYAYGSETLLGGAATTNGFLRLDFGAPAPVTPSPDSVPEPSTLVFLGLGLAGLVAARRKA